MKKYLFLLAAACMAVVSFSSCGKDGDDTDLIITKEYFYGTWQATREQSFEVSTGKLIVDAERNDVYTITADGHMIRKDLSSMDWSYNSATRTFTLNDRGAEIIYDVEITDLTHFSLSCLEESSIRTVISFAKVLEDM